MSVKKEGGEKNQLNVNEGGGIIIFKVFKKRVDWHLGKWFSGHGEDGLTVGLDDYNSLVRCF